MPASRISSLPVWAALLGSGFSGMLVALQSRVNGGLSQQLHNGFLAAALSFTVGLIVMVIAVLLSPRARTGLGRLALDVRSGRLPWWGLTGGAFGGFFVLTQGLVASAIGLALFTVGIVGGQVVGGLVIDRIGLGPSGRVRPTPGRIVGSALAVVAVLLSVLTNLDELGMSGAPLWLIVLPVLAGAGIAWQSAMNGVVRASAASAISATLLNFVVGTAVLVLIAGISVGLDGWPVRWPTEPGYYIGGIIGTIFIALASMLVRTAGVLLLSMSNVAGQLLASVAFEAGLPLAGGVTVGMLIGAVLALLAVTIAALPSRRPAR